MANKKIKIPIDSSDVKKATKAVDDLNQSIDETSSALNDVGVDTGIFDDIRSKVSGAVRGVTNFVKSMRTLKGAIAATGIGLLVVALGSLVSYFKNTEKGARTLAIATEAVGVIFGKLQTFAAELGEKIVDTFSNPKEAISDLKDAIVNNITNRITGLIELFPKLGEAIELTFKGEFKEAAKVSADAIAKVTLGVEDATDKAAELGKKAKEGFNTIVEETKNAVTEAAKYVDAQEGLRKAINAITVANANLTKELETQQKIGEDTTRGYEERKVALENAEAAQLKLAQNVAKQAGLEEDLLRTDIAKTANVEERRELENQLAQKIAERIDAENSLAQVQLDLGQVVRELDLEEAERKQSIADIVREANEDSTLSRLTAALKQSKVDEEAAIRELELLRATEEEKAAVRAGFEQQRKQMEIDAENEAKEKRLQQRQQVLEDFKVEIEEERVLIEQKYQADLEKLREALENELITKQEYAELEKQIEQDKSNAFIDIEKREAEEKERLNNQVMSAKLKLATDTLQLVSEVSDLFAKGDEKRAKRAFQVDKAAKLASATISGVEATINAFKTAAGSPITAVFPAYPAIQAGLAAAFAATNIAKIATSKFESKGIEPSSPSSGSAGGSASVQAAPTPPTVSLFGNAFGSSNQGVDSNQPGTRQNSGGVRAYVVESDITSTQNTLSRYRQRSEIG